MKNDFSLAIKAMEQELLNLKTSSKYSSVRTAYSTQTVVRTGLYRITYQNTEGDLVSFGYGTDVPDNYGVVFLRTPTGNTQIAEVNTDSRTYPSPTYDAQMTIIANKPIVSITRL